MSGARSKAIRIASSHLITSCATIAAILMFVGLGSQVLPPAFGLSHVPIDESLRTAFVLNIAIILFGWRRSKDLKEALDAYEKAERLAQRNANTDPTTGLANRRELLHSLEAALEAKRPGVLLLLDLDHFKRVNDLHGHLAGDQLLKTVAETLVKAAPKDSAARALAAMNSQSCLTARRPRARKRSRMQSSRGSPIRCSRRCAAPGVGLDRARLDGQAPQRRGRAAPERRRALRRQARRTEPVSPGSTSSSTAS